MTKKFFVLLALAVLLFGGVALFKGTDTGTAFLWSVSGEGTWLLPLVSVAALIDSINPCAFSILLLTIAFLFTIGKVRSKILEIGGAYIAGIFTVYIFIGLGILGTLHLFNTPHFMAKVGASVLILWGVLNLINEFFPSFPIKLKIPSFAKGRIAELIENGSGIAAFLLGILVGLCEFPCTGGPYLMVLGLLHDSATYAKGLAYLVYYNALFILPLVLILFMASERSVLQKVEQWKGAHMKEMRLWSGIIMVGLGIIIFLL